MGDPFPLEELPIIDTTVRMFTEPMLLGDTKILGDLWMAEEKRKVRARADLNVTEAELQSSEKFAELLRAEGVEPELKDGKNGLIYSFAKTDQFMLDLQEDENPRVSDLALARLGAKSTIDQTRAERLGNMAMRGPLCVYLHMYGAHTTRWSGGDKVNFQNFRRGGEIRKAIMAPGGYADRQQRYMLGIVDLAQIECRILNFIAGQWDKIEQFKNGLDPYVDVASAVFGYTVNKKDHPIERQVGKVIELQAGYQSGEDKIRRTLKNAKLPVNEKHSYRDAYRSTHPYVEAYWKTAGKMISRLASKDYPPTDWGPMTIKGGKIYGPGGTWLNYTTLEFYEGEDWLGVYFKGWRTRKRNGWSSLYGGKLTENIVQWLARIVVVQTMNRLRPLLAARGIKIVLNSHDELVFALPQTPDMLEVFEQIKQEFRVSPTWLPGIPLDCEGTLSERYEK